MATPKLIILDFDGTLFNTQTSITSTIHKTFATLSPTHTPPLQSIQSQISKGTSITTTFRTLHPALSTQEIDSTWTPTYRALYAAHGQDLVTPYPGAEYLLRSLKERGIPTAIVTNKGVQAVRVALERNGLGGLVDRELVVGDSTVGWTRKPDAGSFWDVLVPALKRRGVDLDGGEGEGVLVVGDTESDVFFARNVGAGARVCWCLFGYGELEGLGVDFVVDSLRDVLGVVDR
ncbi:HAD-like domain-containing protein [Aspergillus avenaceus]|uniref:HAD-like domain-containing protein n=1 Tax=Aspergillus avenaceus TaxID=36643 RepID=A0A5N6TWX7_ASPAV|nr:HAD-like domain-containing protein [Aspergillus avenaceus]